MKPNHEPSSSAAHWAHRPYVLPGKFVLPLVSPEDMGIQPPRGMLFVTLVEATDVRARASCSCAFALHCTARFASGAKPHNVRARSTCPRDSNVLRGYK